MKGNRKVFGFALAVALAAFALPAFAQNNGGGASGNDEQNATLSNAQRDDQLVASMLDNPDEAPEAYRDKLIALKDRQQAIRDAWVTDFRPGDGATAADIKAARDAFRAEYASEIQASREQRMTLMREVRARVGSAINDTAWNEQARALYEEYKLTQSELSGAWRAVRAELGNGATRAEVSAAKERFNESNADLIAQQKELALQVRQLIRDNRVERAVGRGELPEELQELRSDMSALRDQVRSRQHQVREDMRNLGKEEREEYRRMLLEDLKELNDEIKVRRRQIIDEIRGDQNGDRRPEG